ncbi:hypothetical protein ACOPJQ_07640 [Luteimonas dalianensis]|uniref:hypothetical protein n=1 Tax=Luteimonas dalianensis TaxID=1148196 RepID=UPI003BF24651
MDSRDHLEVLQQVFDGSIPARVDERSGLPLAAVGDLVTGGHLAAAQVSKGPDPAWLNLTVTARGRQHLRHLRSLHPPRSVDEGFKRMVPLWLRVALGFLIVVGAMFGHEIRERLGVFQ